MEVDVEVGVDVGVVVEVEVGSEVGVDSKPQGVEARVILKFGCLY